MKTTVETLTNLDNSKPLNLMVGFSKNKDIDKMIKQLATLNPKIVVTTKNTMNPFRKTADPETISKKFKKLLPKTKIKTFANPLEAFEWLKKKTKNNEIFLVTGSIFLSGQLRKK